MNTCNYLIIDLKSKENPNKLTKLAVDRKTREIIGSLKADVIQQKIYSGVKLPPFYLSEKSHFSAYTKPHIYVSDLFVKEGERKKGIGKKLVESIIQESDIKGFEGRVVLLAGNSKEASPLPFYRRIGFSTYDKNLNDKLDYAVKYKLYVDNKIQSFMAVPKQTIIKILKSIQQHSKAVRF